jgi:hypothetical protein
LNRSGFETSRNRIVLTPTVSSDAQVTKIDIVRIGGTLNELHIIGTMPNSGTFNDDFPDDVATAGQAISMQDVLNLAQPFPVLDIPRTGTCDVKGTEVTWVSGDKFNVAAMKDSQVLINNVPYNLYTNPSSDQKFYFKTPERNPESRSLFPMPSFKDKRLMRCGGRSAGQTIL